MNVHVNGDCIGCGMCASLCPNIFFMSEGGTAAVFTREIGPDQDDQAKTAADSCPVSAIEVG